jgi:hypothetical protein
VSKINDQSQVCQSFLQGKVERELTEIRKDLMKNKNDKKPEPEEIKTNSVLKSLSNGKSRRFLRRK